MKNKITKRLLACALAIAMVIPSYWAPVKATEKNADEYLIYPTPHSMEYQEGDYILRDEINVIYDDEIDEATKDRMQEVADLKGLEVEIADEAVDGKTNVYVGVYGAEGDASSYIESEYEVDEALFDKNDSYFLSSDNNVISVLGKNTDASFYGLTTLYHVFAQMDSLTIRNFKVEDWADVVSRGFIEGYYGNPWSTEDRANLMTWGGYYKLNTYFYAPKDDPKHRVQWGVLYTDEEIETKIKPLAEAGNASKCRYAYALHPFPDYYNTDNNLSFGETYEEDLAKLKAKFKQVIDAGVRQIAILADDFWNPGGENGLRLLNDMTDWLENEVKPEYPDMKTTLPYVPFDYMGNGSSNELQILKQTPENVQIVMTGGRVWGEVTDNFTSTFTNNVGRGPFMWINWPCSDNSHKHLIMGGYSTFLHPGVNPSKIQGIMLNPMQQSEASKVAIFGNATYSWNIWDTEEEAAKAWDDSFSFVDHNSAVPTAASDALREMSKHMINQNMDGRVTALQESVELKEILNPFKEKLENETVTAADVDEVIEEFKILQDAARLYKNSGNEAVKGQIIYWLDCWEDTTQAAIAYLNGVKSAIEGDISSVLSYNTAGKEAFDRSKTHDFLYVDYQEIAEVGVQHIVPFINTIATYVSTKAELALDPEKVIQTYITSRTDQPSGSVDNIFDGADGTSAIYKSPNTITAGTYVGVKYSKKITINDIRFVLGAGKDHFDKGRLEYTTDGESWNPIELIDMENEFVGVTNQQQEVVVEKENLPNGFEALGIRFIATEDNARDAWLEVREIQINKKKTAEETPGGAEKYTGTVTFDGISVQSGEISAIFDGDASTEAMLAKGPYVQGDAERDGINAGASMTITFDEPKTVGKFRFQQGASQATDVFSNADVQYQVEGSEEWVTVGTLNSETDQTIDFGGVANVKAIKILNQERVDVWVRVGEITISGPVIDTTPITYTVMKPSTWGVYSGPESKMWDGDDSTFVWFNKPGELDTYVGYDLGKEAVLESAHIVVGAGDGDKFTRYAVETSVDGSKWTAVAGYADYQGVTSGKDVLDIELGGVVARYIRVRNLQGSDKWIKFSEFTVEEVKSGTTDGVYTNIEDSSLLTNIAGGYLALQPTRITLAPGEYAGLDLKNIKTITGVDVEVTKDDSVKLQSSMNTVEWSDVSENGKYKDARYVRLYNDGDADQQVVINAFAVSYNYIAAKSVTSDISMNDSARDMRGGGNVENVFDGNLSTSGSITGPQTEGMAITFDLGQVRDFETIRYYVNENSKDFLRYAKFEVSNNPEAADEDWTEVLIVGDDNFENISNDTVAKNGNGLVHDTQNPGNMYAERTGLDVSGRYLRVVPLKTYSHRWIDFGEIQINGGAYVTTEANKDVVGDVTEEPGKTPSNMFDGDYTTTYKASASASKFVYRISNAIAQRTIRIIQNGKVSNAKVSAVIYKDGQKETVELGTLNQVINEFAVEEGARILEIIVEWGEDIPEIAEMKTSEKAKESVDKSALEAALAKEMNDAWTAASKAAIEAARATAEEIQANEYVTQSVIDSAAGALEAAYRNAIVKGNTANLAAALENKKAQYEDDVEIYSSRSYASYDAVMNQIADAIADAENISEKDIQNLEEKLAQAEAELAYSAVCRERAQLELMNDEGVYNEADYTKDSYKVFADAKAALEAAIAADKEERMNPKEIAVLRDAYKNAKEGLVKNGETPTQADKTDLFELIKYANSQKEDANYQWVVQTVKNVFEDALTKAQEVYDEPSSTQAQVDAAYDVLLSRVHLLGFVGNTTDLQTAVAVAKGVSTEGKTEESVAVLEAAIAKAERMIEEANTLQEDLDAMIIELQDAIDGLEDKVVIEVNKDKLLELIGKAQAYDLTKYTKITADGLKVALEGAQGVYDNTEAVQEEVDSAYESLREAIFNLRKIPNKDELQNLVNSVKAMDLGVYTAKTASAVKAAYANAVAVLNDDNATEDEVKAAVAALNTAVDKLAVKPGEDKVTSTDDGKDKSKADGGKVASAGGKDTGKTAAKTADTMPVATSMMLLAVSALGILLSMKKRKEVR